MHGSHSFFASLSFSLGFIFTPISFADFVGRIADKDEVKLGLISGGVADDFNSTPRPGRLWDPEVNGRAGKAVLGFGTNTVLELLGRAMLTCSGRAGGGFIGNDG